jgi:hypothetical protein
VKYERGGAERYFDDGFEGMGMGSPGKGPEGECEQEVGVEGVSDSLKR